LIAQPPIKLVLLPGMDGTGQLFSPLIASLSDFECQVIPLPQTGEQDHPTLVKHVAQHLPATDFILLGESFAGPIAAILARQKHPHLKGVIFVASFLTPPNKRLLNLARWLPLQLLSRLPLASYFQRWLFLGAEAQTSLVQLFQQTVKSVPPAILRARIDSMRSVISLPDDIALPAVYLRATQDKLVDASHCLAFEHRFSQFTVKDIKGPHFLLQAKPQACAAAIIEAVTMLKSQ
jgi:pimeloyl-ACP methyl ester carboxylesterase